MYSLKQGEKTILLPLGDPGKVKYAPSLMTLIKVKGTSSTKDLGACNKIF